jgi:hypothetical protein
VPEVPSKSASAAMANQSVPGSLIGVPVPLMVILALRWSAPPLATVA